MEITQDITQCQCSCFNGLESIWSGSGWSGKIPFIPLAPATQNLDQVTLSDEALSHLSPPSFEDTDLSQLIQLLEQTKSEAETAVAGAESALSDSTPAHFFEDVATLQTQALGDLPDFIRNLESTTLGEWPAA